MAQSSSEIKVIPPRSISRDRKAHDLESVPLPREEKYQEDIFNVKAPRREFLQAVIPASGKLLAGFLRTVSVTVGAAVEEMKAGQKESPTNDIGLQKKS